MSISLEELWDNIIEHEIATEAELLLVTDIAGYNFETLELVLYSRIGDSSWTGNEQDEEDW